MTTALLHAIRRHGPRSRTVARVAVALGAIACLAAPLAGRGVVEAAAPKPAGQSRIVDPAVVPAGAMACTKCGPACGGHGGRHGHHHGCQDGHCVPYCPVRPDRYGFYGTQWRRWPGQQILQVSNNQEATPVAPPRSEVPGADEESINPPADDLPAPAPEAAAPLTAPIPALVPSQPAAEPTRPAPAPVVPERTPAPAPAPAVTPEPAPMPEVKPEEAPKPVQPRTEDENLFEADAGWRAKRKFAVSRRDADVQPAGHVGAKPQRLVPRVPFDPQAETRQVRAAGGR